MKKFIPLLILAALFATTTLCANDFLTDLVTYRDRELVDSFEFNNPNNVATPTADEEVMHYYYSGNILWIIEQLWGFLIPGLFLFTRLSTIIRNWARRISINWYFSICVYFAIYIILYQLVTLPLTYYAEYLRPHHFSIYNQGLGAWYMNYLIQTSATLIFGFLFIWIPYLVIEKSPKRWWFNLGIIAIPIIILFNFIQPLWLDPMFNKFEPLKNPELREKIHLLAEKARIPHDKIYVVKNSSYTKRIHSYVIGIGHTTRIVLSETAVNKFTPDELMFVVAHEFAHYRLKHAWMSITYFCFLNFVVLYLMYKSSHWIMRRYRYYFGFQTLYDIASLPLLIILFHFFYILSTPLDNGFSQYMEHEADRFALELTQDNKSAADALLILQKENLINPEPDILYKLWIAKHPSLQERIQFANSYRPWDKGQPLFYQSLFQKPQINYPYYQMPKRKTNRENAEWKKQES